MRTQNPKPSTVLAESNAVDLILLIAEKKEIRALDLYLVHTNYLRIFNLARELEGYNILKIHEIRSPRLSYSIKLTAKGEKVAEKLREAKELIGE